MSNTWYRCVVLTAVLAAGAALMGAAGTPRDAAARWPADDALFAEAPWTVGPASVESPWHGVQFVSRTYRAPDGTAARLTIKTHPEAKRIYAANVDVPFLGSGYTVTPAPASLVPPAAGRTALVAERGAERILVLAAYGERRGLQGNHLLAWAQALVDSVLGVSNDYYQVTLLARLDANEEATARMVAELADTLLPRLTTWYRTASGEPRR